MKTNPKRAAHLITGEAGERQAAQFLQQQNVQILHQNYRSPYGEIDLVARDGGCLVFVEVRKRRAKAMVSAAASITPTKMQKIRLTAQHYLQRCSREQSALACRFDAVCIDGGQLVWIKSAFE